MIVGINGYARAGKDTAAQGLVEQLSFRRIAFADALRDLAMELNPLITSATRTINTQVGHGRLAWAIQGLGYEGAKNTYPEVREFLQRLGVAARESFGEDVWVDKALADATADIVVSDVRFKNEADAIRYRHGGVVVRIERPGIGPANDHISEHDLDDYNFDEVFQNDGTPADIQRHLVGYVRNLRETS